MLDVLFKITSQISNLGRFFSFGNSLRSFPRVRRTSNGLTQGFVKRRNRNDASVYNPDGNGVANCQRDAIFQEW